MSPSRRPISRRVAPSRLRAADGVPAAKKMQSPGCAPTCSTSPARSASERFLATGPPSSPSSADQDVGEPAVAALLGELLPGVELASRLRRPARHDDGADVGRLEDAERGVLEVVGALDQLEVQAQVGLVRAVAAHGVGVGHALDRRRDVVADQLPQRDEHGLGHLDDVVLVDEAHLDVELGELGLPVGAEVLVAVAARDLEVLLHAGHHEQLLEQLRRLRQRVPAARTQAGRHEEVARALGRRAGQRRRLDLEEAALVQGLAGGAVDVAAQLDRRGGAGPAQVEVAVLQPRLLPRPRRARRAGRAAGPPR